MRRSRFTILLGAAAAAGLLVAACGSDDSGVERHDRHHRGQRHHRGRGRPPPRRPTPATPLGLGLVHGRLGRLPGEPAARRDLRPGAGGQGLRRSDRELNIGAREVYYKAIVDDEVQILSPSTRTRSCRSCSSRPTRTRRRRRPMSTSQLTELGDALPDDLQVLTPSTAEDKDAIVCTSDIADEVQADQPDDAVRGVEQHHPRRARLSSRPARRSASSASRTRARSSRSSCPLKYGAIPDALVGRADRLRQHVLHGPGDLDQRVRRPGGRPRPRAQRGRPAAGPHRGRLRRCRRRRARRRQRRAHHRDLDARWWASSTVDAADPAEVAKQFLTDNGLDWPDATRRLDDRDPTT